MSCSLAPVNFESPFSSPQAEKATLLLDGLNALTSWHRARCPGYANMIHGIYRDVGLADRIEQVPYLPVRLFKHYELRSVAREAIVRKLTSSGTTSQQVSQIYLDAETSKLQIRALAAIVQDFLGKRRLPMVIIDHKESPAASASFGARTAGVLGFSNFGHHHFYALDAAMKPRWEEMARFLDEYRGQPMLLFGFTFVVWQYFYQAARSAGRSFTFGEDSILIHGGGWKKLIEQQVDNDSFKKALVEQFGIGRVSNYYGMVEQVGSIFVECEYGHLHAPTFADVVMRDPVTLESRRNGVVQVLSLLPRSYPGHSILTEDLGTIVGVDDCRCGRKGKFFVIHGRVPAVEIRGCSDVRTI